MTPTAPAAAFSFPARRMGQEPALWLNGSILCSFLAASTAPSPLYAIYREAWGFSALTLTVVFASYAFALLAALLVFGALSDHRGRRVVLLGALVLEIASTVLFWRATSVGWLLAARIVQGVATGIATSTLGAGLLDLDHRRGALLNSVMQPIGMTVGALGAGALAQFGAEPTRLVYEVLLVLLIVQTLAAIALPETVRPRPGAWASLKPALAIPARARPMLWRTLPVNTATWALGGFYASLAPSLARLVMHNDAPLVGGAATATLVICGAAAILLVRERAARFALLAGTVALLVGVAVTLAGELAHATAVFFAGSAIAGLGFGAAFNGTVRSVVPLAEAHERAGLMSTYYVLSYLAFSVPAMLAGLAVGFFGLQAAALGYGALLVMLAALALVGLHRADL